MPLTPSQQLEKNNRLLNLILEGAGHGEIKTLIGQGARADAPLDQYEDTETALHIAIQRGCSPKIIAELLKGDPRANVNATNRKGITPLHYACANGDADVLKKLLDAGANPSACSSTARSTPLHLATSGNKRPMAHHIKSDYKEVVRLILAKLAPLPGFIEQVNAKDANGDTPLHLAARVDDIECVNLLLTAGANINERDRVGGTPLHYALDVNSKFSHAVLVKAYELGAAVDVNATSNSGKSLLHRASALGNVDFIDILLNNGAEVEAQDELGVTPLQMACMFGHLEAARTLLGAGANVNATMRDGRTALYFATQEKNKDIVALLLAEGAIPNDVKVQDPEVIDTLKQNRQARISSVIDGTKKIQEDRDEMLQAGVPEGKIDEILHPRIEASLTKIAAMYGELDNSKSPSVIDMGSIELAATAGNVDLVKKFIEKSADIGNSSKEGSLIEQASRFILNHNLLSAVTKGDFESVTRSLRKGANPNYTSSASKGGVSPITFAAKEGDDKVIRRLLEFGTDVNSRTAQNMTALMYAAAGGHVETCLILLRAGANPELYSSVTEDGKQKTALHWTKGALKKAETAAVDGDPLKIKKVGNLREVLSILASLNHSLPTDPSSVPSPASAGSVADSGTRSSLSRG